MKLSTRGFHHITLVARDAIRTVQFYHELLGLRYITRTPSADDPHVDHLFFGDADAAPGSLITIFEWPHAQRGHWGVGGIHHVALGVATEDAQLKWKRRLVDAGVEVAGPFDRGWFKSIYFTDPDNQVLEIATAGPGYALDEPIDALGQRIIMPRQSQLRGHRDEAAIAALTWPEPVPIVTADMKLDGIHHITGMTRDIEAMDAFYQEALGLRIIKKSVNQDDPGTPHWFWGSYDGASVGAHSSLTMFGWPTSNYPARAGVGQTHHIAFRCDDAEQQLAWQDHLRTLNLEVTEVMDRTYYTSIYFTTWDGLLMEIATDQPGFADAAV